MAPSAALLGAELGDLPAATWKVADDVGPAAKLLLGGLLALLFVAAERFMPRATPVRYAGNMAAGVLAMFGTLLLIPAAYSRGFGVGLTGARFDPAVLPLYVAGGAAAGLVFTYALIRCNDPRRSRDAHTQSTGMIGDR
ncbi:hypothetical protein CKY28_05610 [Sphingomonas lenta]|uniref:Uncharacterized protein n=1 Tax=Sphingomonas lenta TaxID=1141887 RepID=A0A2A2SHY1_9SPHN|nr:hypothetical protein CKY28_05610 [Sphingomonas lenta]